MKQISQGNGLSDRVRQRNRESGKPDISPDLVFQEAHEVPDPVSRR